MKKITVEAFEDPSRPQGGHAVILLRSVDTMPERASIRLRPVEVGDPAEVRSLWRGGRIEALATRATPSGIELVLGPDIVGHPHLLAGTPVIIEVPEADVRGEFLWPSVAPLAAPRRRHVVVPRNPRRILATPTPANDDRAHLVSDVGRGPMRQQTDGNLALTAEHANGAFVLPSAQPIAIDVDRPHPATERPTASATQASRAVAGEQPDAPLASTEIEDLRTALAAALAAAEASIEAVPPTVPAAAAPSAPSPNIDVALPSRAPVEPIWTPSRREGLLAGNGLLAAVCAVGLVLGLAAWGLAGRRAAPVDSAAVGAGASGPDPAGPKGGGGSGGGASAAAVAPALVAAKPACGEPAVDTEALPAGRMRLTIKAACKAGEAVHVSYGGAESIPRLDSQGTVTTIVDCFAGAADPLEVRFADGARHIVPIKTADLDRVSKVAVIWKAPVNLDLHAFEYAALPGTKGDVWAGAAGSVEAVRQTVAADRKGRGFISTSADALGAGDHVEVYTFLHADDQSTGSVGLAVDHATRGELPVDATCGSGQLAEVSYGLVVLPRGGTPRRESGIIAAASCGSRLSPEVRFNQSALPVLKIRK